MISARWKRSLNWLKPVAGLLKLDPNPQAAKSIKRFVIVTWPRSGSTWLGELLESHPGITCFSDIFAHDHYGHTPDGGNQNVVSWDSYSAMKLPQLRRKERLQLYFRYFDEEVFHSKHGTPTVGFRLMYLQTQRGFGIPAYVKLRNVTIVHLVRSNHLDMILSHEAVRLRKFYHAAEGQQFERPKVRLEAATLVHRLAEREQQIAAARADWSSLGSPYVEVSYEEMCQNPSVVNRVVEAIGADATMELTSNLQKLNPKSHSDLIDNYDEICDTLKGTEFEKLLH